VDFDVFGNAEPPAPEVDLSSEFTETLVVRKPAAPITRPVDEDFDLDDDSPPPARAPLPPARTEPVVAAPAASAGSAAKWWIAAVIAIMVVAAVWFLKA